MTNFENEDFQAVMKSIQYNLTKESKKWKTSDLMLIYLLFGPVKTIDMLKYIKSPSCKIYKLKETTICFYKLSNYCGEAYKVINGRCSCEVSFIQKSHREISPCEHLVVISLLKSLKVNIPLLYISNSEFVDEYLDYSS